jgi:hypothetical protein
MRGMAISLKIHPHLTFSLLAAAWMGAAGFWATRPAADTPQQTIREERVVNVGGTEEVWRLIWLGKISPVCGPEDIESAITCPCSGIAYGESGDLVLVRLRNGSEVDRMPLNPPFSKYDYPRPGESALLPRRPLEIEDLNRFLRGDPKLLLEIERRELPPILQLADYDRDGMATEFLIQVETLPCGKHEFASVGISAGKPRLHALATRAHPNSPLVMTGRAWAALAEGGEPRSVTTWRCGDHASDVREELVVSATKGDIRVRHRSFKCLDDGRDGELVEESEYEGP